MCLLPISKNSSCLLKVTSFKHIFHCCSKYKSLKTLGLPQGAQGPWLPNFFEIMFRNLVNQYFKKWFPTPPRYSWKHHFFLWRTTSWIAVVQSEIRRASSQMGMRSITSMLDLKLYSYNTWARSICSPIEPTQIARTICKWELSIYLTPSQSHFDTRILAVSQLQIQCNKCN